MTTKLPGLFLELSTNGLLRGDLVEIIPPLEIDGFPAGE